MGTALLLLGLWSFHLWPQWLHNPDLSHGLFTPLIFLLLVNEARQRGPWRFLPESGKLYVLIAAMLCAGLTLLAVGGLYAAALGWTHALVGFSMACGLCTLLTALWLGYGSQSVALVPFNWPAAVAILIWLVSAPIPPGTYTRFTLTLQSWVTATVLQTLHLFGVPAARVGNVIELANIAVGVEEACSGIRSLISCVFAGFFFSATLVRAPWARALVIGLSVPLALFMNFLRSLLLTLLANARVDIRGAWHDVTGFAILGLTAGLLAGLALFLERSSQKAVSSTAVSPEVPPVSPQSPRVVLQRLLTAGVLGASVIVAFFVVNTRPTVRHEATPPKLEALLPPAFPTWESVASEDLYRFSSQLQTDQLVQRTYARPGPNGTRQITVYVAYWPPGQAPVSLVASHTPDACWPGSGWKAQPSVQPRAQLTAGERKLSPSEYRFFTQGNFPQHVWYWHLFDGRPIQHDGIGSPRQLFLLALRFGFHSHGEQMFVRISSNEPWEAISSEPLVQEILARLKPVGI